MFARACKVLCVGMCLSHIDSLHLMYDVNDMLYMAGPQLLKLGTAGHESQSRHLEVALLGYEGNEGRVIVCQLAAVDWPPLTEVCLHLLCLCILRHTTWLADSDHLANVRCGGLLLIRYCLKCGL